ncbi:MAG: P-loop NTPase fold protein [Chloroflexota bacterium]|nr:P-loop NTPase fold protein [Chloroflexota bacterium]
MAEPALVPDQPISAVDQDYLGRGEFASKLARQLKSYRDDRCLVVALYAPWGTGKSSLLNLLAKEIAQKTGDSALAPIVIRFNPWNFSNLDSLLLMFFRELQVGAGRSGSKLAKNVQRSLQALSVILAVGEVSPVVGSSFRGLSQTVERGAEALEGKTESLIEVKERTNRELRKLNRRIFVLIDNIDRLDQESMRLMFRLIRLNADFDRMTYVLAFDRDVVTSVLAREQGVSGSEYLEKIVQVGFDIPPAEPNKLQRFFSQSIDKLGHFTSGSEENLIRWIDLTAGGLDKLIRTPRDVVRYVNGLAVSGGIVADEVNPVDLAGIEAVRTFAPELYSFIRNNREIMVGAAGGSWSMGGLTTREQHRNRLDEAYSLCRSELRAAMREICSQLFPETETLYGGSTFSDGYHEVWRKSRRICTIDYFPRYFYLRPPEGEVTQTEFETIVGYAWDHARLVVELEELVGFSKIDSFLVRLGDAAADLPEEHIGAAVLALFDTGDKLQTGLWSENQLLRAENVVHRLLARLTEPERLGILLKAATRAISLGAVVDFTRFYGEHSQFEKRLLDETQWSEVRNRLVTRISTEAEQMSLAQSPHLGILLYRWKDWAPIEECQRFVRRLTESDDGVLAFLQGMIARQSSSAGKFSSRKGWYFPIDAARAFIDPEDLVNPVQRIQSERWADLTDLQREATNAFISARESRSGVTK